MSAIRLQGGDSLRVTPLSNRFIDEYMPQANGEFVKIYIYLLRSLCSGKGELSTTDIADSFCCTERDVVRAFKYWESQGLLTLSFDQAGSLTGICVTGEYEEGEGSRRQENTPLPITPPTTNVTPFKLEGSGIDTAGKTTVSAFPLVQSPVSRQYPVATSEQTPEEPLVEDAVDLSEDEEVELSLDDFCDPLAEKSSIITSIDARRKASPVPSLSADRIAELKQDEDVTSLLYIAEQYLRRPLARRETEKLLYLFDEMHMSVDLIDYLIESCVSHGHDSVHYIVSVAQNWANEGIVTVEQARAASLRFRKDYYSILRYMGISNRNPVDAEIKMMETWLETYGFSLDIIQEACTRTVMQTGSGSFPYADKILKDWHEQEVHCLADIKALDERHGAKVSPARSRQARPTQAAANNRFNNFTQREYDYGEFEKKLLNQ